MPALRSVTESRLSDGVSSTLRRHSHMNLMSRLIPARLRSFVFELGVPINTRRRVWHVPCYIHGMRKTAHHSLTIVMQGNENSMTIEQEGKITLTRASKSGRLWVEPAEGGTLSSVSLASFKVTHRVLRETIQLQGRSR